MRTPSSSRERRTAPRSGTHRCRQIPGDSSAGTWSGSAGVSCWAPSRRPRRPASRTFGPTWPARQPRVASTGVLQAETATLAAYLASRTGDTTAMLANARHALDLFSDGNPDNSQQIAPVLVIKALLWEGECEDARREISRVRFQPFPTAIVREVSLGALKSQCLTDEGNITLARRELETGPEVAHHRSGRCRCLPVQPHDRRRSGDARVGRQRRSPRKTPGRGPGRPRQGRRRGGCGQKLRSGRPVPESGSTSSALHWRASTRLAGCCTSPLPSARSSIASTSWRRSSGT